MISACGESQARGVLRGDVITHLDRHQVTHPHKSNLFQPTVTLREPFSKVRCHILANTPELLRFVYIS
jgi:hypothetical protein